MTTNKPSAVIPELFAYEGTAMNSFFFKYAQIKGYVSTQNLM